MPASYPPELLNTQFLNQIEQLCNQAGQAILKYYGKDLGIQYKSDASPVTLADLSAHTVLVQGLKKLTPQIPILSEEQADVDYTIRQQWQSYWLIDPLDGTREFIEGNGEFTVNVALIHQHSPVLGVVSAPILNTLYSGCWGSGAFRQQGNQRQSISVRHLATETQHRETQDTKTLTLMTSRRHGLEKLQNFISGLEKRGIQYQHRAIGSSLKICLIAAGEADCYPRFGATCEWDTAAAQCVLELAGGKIIDTSGRQLTYNTEESLYNPEFYALGDISYPWQDIL